MGGKNARYYAEHIGEYPDAGNDWREELIEEYATSVARDAEARVRAEYGATPEHVRALVAQSRNVISELRCRRCGGSGSELNGETTVECPECEGYGYHVCPDNAKLLLAALAPWEVK